MPIMYTSAKRNVSMRSQDTRLEELTTLMNQNVASVSTALRLTVLGQMPLTRCQIPGRAAVSYFSDSSSSEVTFSPASSPISTADVEPARA